MESPIHILVVDDDAESARAAARALTQAGYQADVAIGGAAALSVLQSDPPELVLLDRDMPAPDGLEVLRQLRLLPGCAEVFVVFLSGSHVEAEAQIVGLESGADAYVLRPIGNRELVARVDAFVRLVRVDRELRAQARELAEKNRILQMQRAAAASLLEDAQQARAKADDALATLRERERVLATLMSNLPGMAYRCRNEAEWTMEFVSAGAQALTGYAAADLTNNRYLSYANLIHPADRGPVWEQVQAALARQEPFVLQYRLRHANGDLRWVWEQGQGIRDAAGQIVALEGFVADITERKAHEAEIARLTSLYAVQSRVSQCIVRATSETALFAEICEVLATYGHFKLVWIGLTDPASQTVPAVASAGAATEYLQSLTISLTDSPQGNGPTGTCLRENRPYICNDFCADPRTLAVRAAAARHGFAASAALPIHRAGQPCGAINLYAAEVGFFGEPVVALLEEIARDVSFALDHLAGESERQRIERALILSQVRLQAIMDQTPSLVYAVDPAGKFTFVNAPLAVLLGRPAAEIVGQTRAAFLPPDVAERHRANDLEVIRSEQALTFEESNPEPDGLHTYVTVKFPLHDEHGVLTAVCGISTDITSRQRAEAELRRDEARFRSLSQLLQYRGGTTANFLDFALRELGSLTGSEVAAFHLRDATGGRFVRRHLVIHGQTVPTNTPCPDLIAEAVRLRGPAFGPVEPGQSAGGTALRHYLALPVLRDGDPVAVAVVANKPDAYDDEDIQQVQLLMDAVWRVVEQRQALAELQTSEERFRSLVETAPEAVFIQCDGVFAYVNAATLRLFGAASSTELLGQPVLDRFHPDWRAQVGERIRQLNNQRTPVASVDEVCLTLAGSPRDVNVSATPFVYQGRHGALVFARDITLRKQAEAKVAAQLQEVRRWHEALVGREQRFISLKREVNELLIAAGQPPRYGSALNPPQ